MPVFASVSFVLFFFTQRFACPFFGTFFSGLEVLAQYPWTFALGCLPFRWAFVEFCSGFQTVLWERCSASIFLLGSVA